jgi:ribonuclease Z
VLFTHAHIDHMGGVAHHVATRALLGMAPPTYVVPPGVGEKLTALLDAFRALDGSDLPCKIVEAAPGEAIPLAGRRIARPFATRHPVQAQGYVIHELRQALREDLVGKAPEVIRAARDKGETVSETVEHPVVAFSGDTQLSGILDCADALRARLLIMEVSFVDDRVSVDAAQKNGHVHLHEVIAHAEAFENQALLFTHLSARYRQEEAQEILRATLPASLADRVTLLPRPPWCN